MMVKLTLLQHLLLHRKGIDTTQIGKLRFILAERLHEDLRLRLELQLLHKLSLHLLLQ